MATLIGPELIDPDLTVTGLAAARLFASSRPRPRGADAAPLLSGLTRAPGGTYSSTVEVIHFTDGSSAHTDLIRLNPNIDAYSLDFAGVSPRQLCHYREVPAAWTPALRSAALRASIGRVLAAGHPHVSTAALTGRLRSAGHRVSGSIREHEAIAATQAALWRLTNHLELDTRPLDEPVRASARIGEHPASRRITPDADGIAWHTQLPAGETVYLELALTGAPQLQAYEFSVGSRTGRHATEVHLESSLDGATWRPVSRSTVVLGDRRPGWRTVRRQLGAAATLSSAGAAGQNGHPHYRLAARGPEDRDGLLDLHGIRLELTGGARFRNNERIVALYRLLLAEAHREDAPTAWPRALIGSRTPHGPAAFTPLVAVGASAVPSFSTRIPTHEGAFDGR